MIFGRLLVGYLNEKWAPGAVDLIVANPPSPSRFHTTRVIAAAAGYDAAGDWPFDDPDDPAVIKTEATEQSANRLWEVKRRAAEAHARALELCHPNRIEGKRIIVYDDICTTGLQINEVARRLREWGAVSVHGVVLARQPWGDDA